VTGRADGTGRGYRPASAALPADPAWHERRNGSGVALAPGITTPPAGFVVDMIDDTVRQLAQGPNFAALSTLMPDGQPQTQVMWVDADDTHVLINTELGRQKWHNVERDPRVTVTVIDRDNPYHYAEVRGRVVDVVRGPEARAHIDALSNKYNGTDYDPAAIGTERVILRIEPAKVHVM
jgi:PPOX class probable F420-dependent enzyme